MSVSNVAAEAQKLSLVDLIQEARAANANASSLLGSSGTLTSSNALLSSAQNKKAQSAYSGGGATTAIGQAALQRALSEMDSSNGRITFKQIGEHREKLELEFTITLRAELFKLGVPLEAEFSLNMDKDGKIDVLCDDPIIREKIQKFLADNPKICEQFGYIQALSNLERAQQSPASGTVAWQQVRNSATALQVQALEAFFGAALNSGMDYAGTLASFGPGAGTKASFYTGLNFTV